MKLFLNLILTLTLFTSMSFPTNVLHAAQTEQASGLSKEEEEKKQKEADRLKVKEAKEAGELQKSKETEKANWELYSSTSGVYTVRFPKDYKYKSHDIYLNDSATAYSEEIIASLDTESDPENVKNYLVKMEQSIGSPISNQQAKKFLDEEVKKYEDFAEANKGKIVTNEDLQHDGFLGKDLFITYDDISKKKSEELALRIRILYTDTAKIQMVLSGKTKGMYSYYADNFFGSIKLSDGFGRAAKAKNKNWPKFSDANNIFSISIPPKHPEYRRDSPRYKLSKRVSSVHTVFTDPVLNQKIFYNVYAYKIGAHVNSKIVRKIIFSQHISKFVEGAPENSLKLKSTEKDGYTIASTQLLIDPKQELPYLDAILLRAYYKDKYIVVQEIAGSQGNAFGDFGEVIMNSMLFHPEKYTETTVKEILQKNKLYLTAKASGNSPEKQEKQTLPDKTGQEIKPATKKKQTPAKTE